MEHTGEKIRKRGSGDAEGIFYAILSSSSFGFSPFFSVTLLSIGLSTFEVLSYRWGIATSVLVLFAAVTKKSMKTTYSEFMKMFLLSIFRAGTSVCLLVGYANIASGVSSTIHFMYPIAVAIGMAVFMKEKSSPVIKTAIILSIAGAYLLASDDTAAIENGNSTIGIIFSVLSVISYSAYMILMKVTGSDRIEPTKLTCYVMGLSAIFFFFAGEFTGGVRLVTDLKSWLYILGLSIVATTISNFTLVKAISRIGPTLASVFGALEPLTAIVLGVAFFAERLSFKSISGIILIVTTVTIVVVYSKRLNAKSGGDLQRQQ